MSIFQKVIEIPVHYYQKKLKFINNHKMSMLDKRQSHFVNNVWHVKTNKTNKLRISCNKK